MIIEGFVFFRLMEGDTERTASNSAVNGNTVVIR